MESCPDTHRGPSHGLPVTVRHRVAKVRQSPRKRVEMAISDGEGQPSGASMEQASNFACQNGLFARKCGEFAGMPDVSFAFWILF